MASRDDPRSRPSLLWLARFVVGVVFILNVSCALAFLLRPDRYAPGFELSGVQGRIMVQAMGILFLMWNATYPLVVIDPQRYRTLFAVVFTQQAIGVVGETWLLASLPVGHPTLWATGVRFIVFDGLGLAGMGILFWLLGRRP
ncbi:MAG: hypothetical protein AMJ88_16455 [Anaerolineae bacterium SM23_ 63]|nr:MAG: hypothetical protein AMJ88_16455 [Anaerolineae bacterium SM23_ 63]